MKKTNNPFSPVNYKQVKLLETISVYIEYVQNLLCPIK